MGAGVGIKAEKVATFTLATSTWFEGHLLVLSGDSAGQSPNPYGMLAHAPPTPPDDRGGSGGLSGAYVERPDDCHPASR